MGKFFLKFQSTEGMLRWLVWIALSIITLVDFLGIQAGGVTLILDYELINGVMSAVFVAVIFATITRIVARNSLKDGYTKFSNFFYKSSVFLDMVAYFFLFIPLFVVFSYLATISQHPLYDDNFYHFDKSLGFNWLNYLNLVNRNAWLNGLLEGAYHSTFQIPTLFLGLAVFGKHIRLYSVMLSLILSVIICIIVSHFFPAVGNATYLGIDPQKFPNVEMAAGYVQVADLHQMREGSRTIDLSQMKGVITFPSFHTCLAIILAWGFWSVRLLRYPFLLVNMVMLAAIPVTGGHYLADMVAGAVIALLVISGTSRFTSWHEELVRVESSAIRN